MNAICVKENSLVQKNFPYIAHIKINESLSHFIVIYSIKDGTVEVMDPAKGYEKINIDDLNRQATGYIIYLTPNNNLVTYKDTNIIKNLVKINLVENRKEIIKILILSIIFIILSLFEGSFISIITLYPFYKIIFICIIIILINYSINYINNNKIKRINNKITNNIMDNFFNHVFRLPLKYFHIKDREEILKRFVDLENIVNITLNVFINNSINIIMIIFTLFTILIINKHIFLILLIYTIINILLSYYFTKKIVSKINQSILSENSYKSKLTNYILSIVSIIHNNSQTFYIEKINNFFKKYNEDNYILLKSINKLYYIKNILISCLTLILIFYNIKNNQNINSFVIVYFLLNILNNSLNNITGQFTDIIYKNKNIYKVNDFYGLDKESESDSNLKRYDINIKNLSFKYFDKVIFNNFNLKIKEGEKIIVKGNSGCGKTTLCKLLIKYYSNYEGLILIDNQNLKDISPLSLREKIIYSGQNEAIIQGTIKENILMGKNLSDNELNNIIELTRLNRVVKKKSFGIDTYLFGGGNEVSGGEKQLILLARALANKPKVLILDETLSMVNEKLENIIIKNLFNYYQDTTIIYITHKNSKKYFTRTVYM